MEIKDFIKDCFVDEERANGVRMGLVKAYCINDHQRLNKAVVEAQKYVDEGGDFPLSFWQYDDTIEDYSGSDADMLAEKYLVRLLHDRFQDDDDDQQYIATGLTGKEENANYELFKKHKARYPEHVLLFRDAYKVGYHAFEQDADTINKVLDCQLLDWCGIKAAAFPDSALDINLAKLIRAGYKAAVVDPFDDKEKTRKQVEFVKQNTRQRNKPVQLSLNF